MTTRYRYIVLPIVLIALLAAFSTPASAVTGGCPSETKYSETIHGGIYFVAQAPPSAVFTDVPDGIKLARLYTGAWGGSPGGCEDFSLTINDFTTETYHACDPDSYPERCSVIDTPECRDYVTGCGVHFIAYNATPHITPGDNTISTSVPSYYGYVLGLLVVYEDPSMPEITYWINEGSPLMISGSGCDPDSDEIFINFDGATGSTNAMKYWTLGFPSNSAVNPELNGNDIGAPDLMSYLYRWDNIPTSYLNPSSNLFYYYHPNAEYERVYSAVLMLEQGEPSPDTTPPYTDGHNPAKDVTDIPLDTNIVVHVRDDHTGVDQSTIVMTVEGGVVEPTITGAQADYTITYTPTADFGYGQVVDVTIDASDLNGTPNVMTTDSYSFTTQELEPSTPFLISDWVNNSAGSPVNNPLVNVTNTNTSEVFTAEATADSNYYQILISSEDISAGNVLHFYASDSSNVEEFDHTVTESEMNAGGFEENITIRFPYTDLIVTGIDAYHNATGYPACFNLYNEIDVTVENIGTDAATSSHVSLYIDGELSGKQSVPVIDPGCSATVQFGWTPTGTDCEDEGTPITYTLRAVADCDGEIDEENEGNNESTTEETAYWAGYSADESLNTAFHGTIHGGLDFTTGDGVYTSLYDPGVSTDIHYDITLPDGASVELARLNVYYTWSQIDETGVYPSMEVNITNASGTHTLSTVAEYNDRPCDTPAITYDYPFGNYVYDLSPYVNESRTYTVTVKNVGSSGHSFCIDPPGMVILYNDSTKPEYEYWILEGADLLEGGRRGGAGNLALSECINNAIIEGTIDLSSMESATLGLATPWGGDGGDPSYLYFNGVEIGKDVYHGYSSQYSETLNGMSMHIGSTHAQMGVNLTDVTTCLDASNNVVGQGDDGDSMLVANVFMLLERGEAKQDDVANADTPVSGTVTGSYPDTQVSDDVYESITEVESGGKPANRYSHLEHKWTVDVTGGSDVTFYLEAYRSPSSDGDDFVFAYSTDDSTYIDMATVTKIADDGSYQTFDLPSDLSGTVYIRVKDTDQTAGNKALDTIHIDHLFIRSGSAPPSYGVTVAIDEASQTVSPGNSTTYTVRVKNTGDLDASYSVVMGGTAVDESTIGVLPSGWNTGTLAPNAEYVQTVTVSTTASTPETTYTLTAAATCDQDASVTDSATSELVVSSAEYTDDKANGDTPVAGTVSGSYPDTQVSDDVYESITEVESGGKPANRYSHLEHKWTVDVTGGSDVTFYLEAYRSPSSDGDDFVFAYSTDDSTYIDMATVTKIADDGSYQTFDLPSDLSGTVYIRVKDTDQTAGNKALDTIHIDHLFIRSGSAPPSYGVTVTIDEASQTVTPGDGTTYTVRVKNTGDFDASYSVVMTGTAVDESTIGVDPLNWNTGTLALNAEYVQTVTVSTTASTPETTYALTAAATCDQDVGVIGSATSDLVVSSVTNAMHIVSIDMSFKTAGPNTNAVALVTIVDAAGAPVEGATVEGHWSDATSDTDSGVTVASGEVSLDSDKLKSPPSGTVFTFTVDGVSLAGWTYDSGANVETSDGITVP